MWSHYADKHRGFVIGFEATIFQIDQQYTELREVNYFKTRPIYSIKEDKEESLQQSIEFLFTKSLHWGYEKELRSIVRLQHSNEPFSVSNSDYPRHLFDFPVESVKEVVGGWKMPASEREKFGV